MQRKLEECKAPHDLVKARALKELDVIRARFPELAGESSRENEEGFFRDLEPYLEPEKTT